MSQLVILLSIFITVILNATPIDFICNGAACSCSNGDCRHMCLSNECASKYFMCLSSATSCIVDCYGTDACKDAKIYGAADTVILNCNGTNSCDGTQLSCGRPNAFPNNYLSRTYNTNQFNGQIKDCFVNLLTPNAMRYGDITCDGPITNCIIEAYNYNSISQSLFECKIANTNGNGCELNCLQDSNCDSIDFQCNTLSHCSCGIIDKNCDNSNVYLTTEESQTGNIIEKSNQYNCVDLVRTEVKIKSALKTNRNIGQGKEATFNYQICGKDINHTTILFRYGYESQDINKHSLSGSLHDIHHSVYFIEHEENGAIYDFEWEFNIPNIICWLTNELYAFKIDLYYDKNVSFAFTYLYSEDMKSNNKEQLTARNLWNKELTSLEEGYIYFNYHYNITLYNPETISPTNIPTIMPTSKNIIIIIPSQTSTNDRNNLVTNYETTTTTTTTTTSYLREGRVIETTNSNINMNHENVKIKTNNTNETPIKGLLFGISLVAVLSICCIIACIIYHQKKRQNEGMEATYASAAGGDSISDNEADIDDTDININELPNERMSSGVLDENDLIDINQNINQMKKYIKRDASNIIIIPGKEQSESHSESGIGYIANSKQLSMNDDDDDDESLIVRDMDISMDAEYHHVITHQPEISIMQEEEILNRVNIKEDSISKQKQKQKQKEREISISQSMSRLSQSLSIPPIELNEEITNVKTYKTKTTVQSAATSMKLFSQKIAKAAVKFGHNPLNPNPQSTSSVNKIDNKINNNNNNEYATMVIYKNESTSKIPQSQIKTSTTPPPITSIDIVNTKFLNLQSTQTMIVKNLYDDSNDSLDDYSNDSNDRDPIDVSEEDDIIEMKRHKKNLSNVSNKSYHDRRTMIINDDLTINHLVNSIEEDDEQHQQH